jgi:hypothetical protein
MGMVVISLFTLVFRGFRGVMAFHVHNSAAALAMITRFTENLQQTSANALSGHLDQTKRSNFSYLMLGAIST